MNAQAWNRAAGWILATVFVVTVLALCSSGGGSRTSTPMAGDPAAMRRVAERLEECKAKVIPQARAHAAAGEFGAAIQALDVCAAQAPDASITAARNEIRGQQEANWLVANPKAEFAARLSSLREVQSYRPDLMTPQWSAELKRLEGRYDAEAERARKAAEAKDRANRKKEGVVLGMTKDEVLMSSWGKPKYVNTDVYASGRREQWVYDGGYLYFRGDRLDGIQMRGR